MAELTIQIPDDLAERLKPLQNRLPELLSQLLNPTDLSPASTVSLREMPQAYLEVLDFLTTQPSPQDILAFKVSPQAQERLSILLSKNKENALTEAETRELDAYEQLEHLMILLKARAVAAMK
ncbi:MAG: hypothetical protein HC840_04815 [Leptolyngbyaceae cyanobacterium RM2_2_4]|nr:hypothetical protein [Leptolyngbyaceae cyanobacterium SM1_4_3]NJO48899.1 hypothetical protein [Leptolyngbyaceae cyanobacterium RM2_2_4]